MDIIQYLLSIIQYLYQQNCWLINFICRYIPLKQWAYEDSHSPKHQKFKVDELSRIKTFIKQDWQFLLNTIYGDTPNPSSPFKDATARLFQKTSSVLYVALPTTSSRITTAAMGNISARSAARRFPLVISLPLLFVCCALTAGTLS